MSQDWIDASRQVPEEDGTVLVYLECHHVTLGIFQGGKWHTVVAPWDSVLYESEVLCWSELPERPAGMLDGMG
jgi:hypothetical protein